MQDKHPTYGPSPTSPTPIGLNAVPLFHAALLFSAGIAITHWLWLPPSFVLIALAMTASLCLLAAFRAQRILWLTASVLWLLLGTWSAETEPHPAPAPAIAALSDGLLRTVEGTVINAGALRGEIEQNLNESEFSSGTQDLPTPQLNQPPQPSQSVDLRVSALELVTDTTDIQQPTPGSVRLTIRWPSNAIAQPLRCGDRIRADVRLLPPEVYHDPGVWSREDYLVNQGITSSASVAVDRVTVLHSDTPPPTAFLACRLTALQHATTARLLALPAAMRHLPAPLRLSPDDAIMLSAMVAGDRTFLTHNLRTGFERTGSFHMLVVSGFHLAIVAGCIFWLARRLRLPRVPATLFTLFASFAYALFTGFATPVQRSLWMVALYLIGRIFYRDRSPLNTIGFAALCLLAVSPRSLLDASMQMTLLAVIAIAGIAAPLLQNTIHPYLTATRDLRLIAIDSRLSPPLAQFRVTLRMLAAELQPAASPTIAWRTLPWATRFALRTCELFVVSCVAELAMTLPMAFYFNRITIAALPVNVLILPLLALLMPAALLTLLALAVWPAAAVVPAMLTALPLHFSTWLVHLFGSMAYGDFRIPAPLLFQSALFCSLLAASIVLARGSRLHRRLACAALVLAALAALAPRPIQHPHNALLMEAIDVGQGDSLLLITPDGKTLLIDGGGFGGGPHQAPQEFDIGEEVVSQVLWSRGIRHLDAVALTHAHSDHMGGLPAVLRNFHPDELWVGNNPHFAAYNALLSQAAALHVRLRTLRAGDSLPFGNTQIAVLAPFRDYQPGAEPTNNDSLVLHMTYGATSVMLEGDAEAPIEQAMLANDRLPQQGLQSTLLKVGHHGSVSSTRPEFLAAVAPQWAVISCGLHNRYGHPRQEVLEELQAAHIRTFRTDINGATCFRLDGQSVATEPDCASQQAQ